MTLSIVARCADTGMLGIAAMTGTPGVGKLLAWAEADVGAVATQGWVNPYLGVDGLALLRTGHRADRTLRAITLLDDDRELRQVGVVDRHGGTAVHTGAECSPTAGHRTGDGYTVQGNLLESERSLDAAETGLADSAGHPLVERLIIALEAAAEVGGDRRGHRSASAFVVDTEQYPLWDVRVDDHPDPLPELRRLVDAFERTLLPQIRKLPTRQDPHGELETGTQDGLL